MKFININHVFIGLSGKLFSVGEAGDNISELRICGKDTNNCVVAYRVVGSRDEIYNQILDFLKSNKNVLVLTEAELG